MQAEEKLIKILQDSGVDFVSSLPCEKVKTLIHNAGEIGTHVPLTREEEGVGISAGAALAGKKPAMIIQSSGFGNMVNALLSLTKFYKLPLAFFVSRRGIYKEKIAAQVPMGQALPALLKACGISFTEINKAQDLTKIGKTLREIYKKEKIHAFLLSPAIWEGSPEEEFPCAKMIRRAEKNLLFKRKRPKPVLARYEVIEQIAPFLKGKLVVSNLGWPSKEFHHLLHQDSNFYMLGSMGMATPIGLGLALSTKRKVYVIDGDGSILMNPGTLATAAYMAPPNLTIICIDNGVYGSTGGQPTCAASVSDLSQIARGMGIQNIYTLSQGKEIISLFQHAKKGPSFVRIIARPGNWNVPNIPFSALQIKENFRKSIQK